MFCDLGKCGVSCGLWGYVSLYRVTLGPIRNSSNCALLIFFIPESLRQIKVAQLRTVCSTLLGKRCPLVSLHRLQRCHPLYPLYPSRTSLPSLRSSSYTTLVDELQASESLDAQNTARSMHPPLFHTLASEISLQTTQLSDRSINRGRWRKRSLRLKNQGQRPRLPSDGLQSRPSDRRMVSSLQWRSKNWQRRP